MDFIRKIGLGCRQHYEKIVLGLALIGLALAVWYLDQASKQEDQKIREFLADVEKTGKLGNITPIDSSEFDAAMKLAQNPPSLNFSLPHNLFNPLKWQRRPNGELVVVRTGKEIGWDQMVATKITPLNFTMALDRVANAGGFFFGLSRDAADKPIDRKKKTSFVTLNVTNRFFDKYYVLREIKGPADNPAELVVEMTDTNEKISITKDKPYVKVEGYEADLKYNIDGKTFNNLRVDSSIVFQGDAYKIVAISQNEVVASAQLNDKKHTVRYSPAGP